MIVAAHLRGMQPAPTRSPNAQEKLKHNILLIKL